MLSQNQIALLINTFSQLTTNTNYVTTTRINASYKTTQSFNYEGNTVKPLLDIYSGNQVVILKDTSTGKYYAIREDFDPVLNERTFTRKYREERKKIVKQEADVAVLLCCELNNRYEFWITFLGRKSGQWAYVGWTPRRLDINDFWGYESQEASRKGRFEFWPYIGATGGGIENVSFDSILLGAEIGAGNGSMSFSSTLYDGRDDLGGIVTPKWEKVLTDYTLTGFLEIKTPCQPLGEDYTDISWEWEGENFASDKLPGERSMRRAGDDWTYSTRTSESGLTWAVVTSEGSVFLRQESAPDIREGQQIGEETEFVRFSATARQVVESPETEQFCSAEEGEWIVLSVEGVGRYYVFSTEDDPKDLEAIIEREPPIEPGEVVYARLTGLIFADNVKCGQPFGPLPIGPGGPLPFLDGWGTGVVGTVGVSDTGEGVNKANYYTTDEAGTVLFAWYGTFLRPGDCDRSPLSSSTQYIKGAPSVEYKRPDTDTPIDSYNITIRRLEGGTWTVVDSAVSENEPLVNKATYPIPSPLPPEDDSISTALSYGPEIFEGPISIRQEPLNQGYPNDCAGASISHSRLVVTSKGVSTTVFSRAYSIDYIATRLDGSPPSTIYTLSVFDENNVEVASFVSNEPISSEAYKSKSGRTELDIHRQDEPSDGLTDFATYRTVNDEDPLSVGNASPKVTFTIVREGAKGEFWFNNSKEVELEIEGFSKGQRPLLPTTPSGIQPCNPQIESEEFDLMGRASEGFQIFALVEGASKDRKSGSPHVWEPFDFGSVSGGYAPDPSINFTFVNLYASVSVDYEPKGFLTYTNFDTDETIEKDSSNKPRLYPNVQGFIYGIYGRVYDPPAVLSPVQEIDESLAEYLYDWVNLTKVNNRPRMGDLRPNLYENGPFDEVDIEDRNQRTVEPFDFALGNTFSEAYLKDRRGYYSSERDRIEDWRSGMVSPSPTLTGGANDVERSYWDDPGFNVAKKSGKSRYFWVDVDEIQLLVKSRDGGRITLKEFDASGKVLSEDSIPVNPIKDVFLEGQTNVKVIAAAAFVK